MKQIQELLQERKARGYEIAQSNKVVEKEVGICMSQEVVLKILKELGGEATIKEIRDRAKSKYPTTTLYTYVIDRLRKLKKWDDVEFVKGKWRIKKSSK